MSLVFSELVFAVYRLCVGRLCSLLWPVVCWQGLFGCFLDCRLIWLGISRMRLMYEVVDFGLLIGLFSILMSV
jgi:hypothetical protein